MYGASHPKQKRIDIVVMYIATHSIADTAFHCKVSYNCVKKLVDIFQQKAALVPQTQANSRPKIIPWWLEMYIEAIIVLFPTLYIREVHQMLGLAPNNVPSCSCIRKLLARNNISRKKCTVVAAQRFIPFIQRNRQLFFEWRRTVDPRAVYFFDESSFGPQTDERVYGRSDSGFALATYSRKGTVARSQSVMSAIGYVEGILTAVPIQGNFTILMVNEVIEKQILPLLPNNVYLLADNASVHNETNLANILSAKNITLVMLPAYSYDLNPRPIEMIFGMAKAVARKTPGALAKNALLAIVDAFLGVSTLNVQKFYRRSWQIFH